MGNIKSNLKILPLIFGLIALIAILGCGSKRIATASATDGPSVNLPDGTVLTLKSVSVGYEHEFTFKGMTQKYSYAKPGGEPVSSLELWFYQTARPGREMSKDVYFTVADESGVVHLPHGTGSYQCLQTNCLGERLVESHFDAFPRRAANLTFHVHTPTNNEWMIAASFKIPNPARGSFTGWHPEPLPATRQNSNLVFSLTSLKVRTNTSAAGTEAFFSVTSNGVPASDWQVESLRLKDATGNRLDLWSGDSECTTGSNGLFFATNRWLDLEEPAWTLHAEFSHKAGYGPQELVTITNVPAKADAYIAYGSCSATLKDAVVAVTKISREANWGGNTSVKINVTPVAGAFRIALVKATNERGEQIALAPPPRGYGNFSGYASHFYGLNLPDDTKTLNLTFAYQESRFADYTVKPEVVSIGQIAPPQ